MHSVSNRLTHCVTHGHSAEGQEERKALLLGKIRIEFYTGVELGKVGNWLIIRQSDILDWLLGNFRN